MIILKSFSLNPDYLFPRRRWIILIGFVGFIISLIFTWIPYPSDEKYSIITHAMSYLGNPNVNPGWFWFSVGLLWLFLTFIPSVIILLDAIDKIQPWGAKANQIFYSFGLFFFSLVAFLPHYQDESIIVILHRWVAIIAGGLLAIASALAYGRAHPCFSSKLVRLGVVGYYVSLFWMIVVIIYTQIMQIPQPAPILLSFTLIEWIGFFLYLFFFNAMVWFLPKKK